MRYLFLLLIIQSSLLLNGQLLQPLESSEAFDVVLFAEITENKLIYNTSRIYYFALDYLEDEPKESASFSIYNLETNEKHRLPYFSTQDSVNTVSCMVQSEKQDTIYFIRSFATGIGNVPKQYFLVETDYDFSFVNEYVLFGEANEVTNSIDFIPNAFFRKDGNLIINAYSLNGLTSMLISLNRDEFEIEKVTFTYGFWQLYGVNPIEDSTFVKIRGSGLIDYYDFNLELKDSVTYSEKLNLLGLRSQYLQGDLYFGGNQDYFVFQESDTYIHTIYRHDLETKEVTTILADTLEAEYLKAANNVSAIDSNYVYSGLNLEEMCIFDSSSPCDTEMRIYSSASDGTLNWKKDFGGDANHFLWHVIATPDTGVLAIFYRYDENVEENLGDVYWLKFNKDGSQDLDYLSGFSEVIAGIEEVAPMILEIKIFPNPSNGQINFSFPALERETYLQIYNSYGQEVKNEKIAAFSQEKQLHLRSLPKGIYYWQFNNESGKLLLE